MAQLIEQAGLKPHLVLANQAAHKRFIGKKGRVLALPTGIIDALNQSGAEYYWKIETVD